MIIIKLRNGTTHLLYDVEDLLAVIYLYLGDDVESAMREFLAGNINADDRACVEQEMRSYEMTMEDQRALLMDIRDMAEQEFNGKSVSVRKLAKAIYNKINAEL